MAEPAPDYSPQPTQVGLVDRRSMLDRHAGACLQLDGVSLGSIAREFGTPVWVVGAATFEARLHALAAQFGADRLHYAVKANDRLALLALVRQAGAGLDVVSAGEYQRALAAGFPPAAIVFSGVGKTRAELERTVADGIGQINVESVEELALLSEVAHALGRTQRVAIRVNPDIEAGTHDKISTGRAGDKFGIAADEACAAYAQAARLPGLAPVGLAFHIGSQILEPRPFGEAARVVASMVDRLRAQGLAVEAVDCGGGLGIGYGEEPDGDPAALRSALMSAFGGRDVRLSIEPGRWIAGPAGVLLASVIRTKRARPHPFVVLDAAMNDLARPALYGSWHGIVPVEVGLLDAPTVAQDVVGPVCETGDVLARARLLPALPDGAIVAILDAGAYGAVMSSTYNARPLAAEVLVDAGRASLIRERQDVAALHAGERVPERLRKAGGR